MPPTVQSGSREDRERRGRTGGRSELVCRVKYNNTLPDIPFDPKFITYPFESNRFVQYNPTSLERAYKHELLTEHDLGITIDLINPDTYKIDLNSYLDVEDEKLLEEEVAQPQDSKRSKFHSANVSWLRKTEYISTEYNRFTQSADKAESRVGYSIKKALKEEDVYRDRESQIKAIESTFEAAKKPIMNHYSKPGVTAVSVLPVFPDFDMWKHPCAQVIFDSDPAPKGHTAPTQMEEMSQAMIRGMVDESGDQFVAYFLPTEETVTKRKRDHEMGIDYEPDEEYDYMLSREYNWNVKNKSFKGYEENYFFVFKENGVYYNELETRVRLSKRRKVAGSAPVAKSRLIVKHRELNEQEYAALDARMMMLEPAMEEEEEEEMEYVDPDLPKSGDEAGSGDEGEKADGEKNAQDDDDDKGSQKSGGSRKSRSRSRSRSGSRSKSRSRSRSGSRSGSGSRSRSRSRSASPSRSRSRSKMKSRSRSRSQSGSPARSRSRSKVKSRSRSRSQSGSPARSRSRSKGKSRSRSRSQSGSPAHSPSRAKSRSRSRSQSGSPARSRSRSRSQSGSPARSGSGSPAGSPARSPTGSPSRSRSRSRVKSKSKSVSRARSRSRSGSKSPSRSRSRSRSRSHSGSRSRSRSQSRSRSGSPARSGSGSGSDREIDSKKKDEEEIFGSGSDSD